MYERIKRLCAEKGTNISRLERELGFANASLTKADSKMQSQRLYQLARYFGVSMEYLLTGEEPYEVPKRKNTLDDNLLSHAMLLAQLPEERQAALFRYIEVEYDFFKNGTAGTNKGGQDIA